MSPNLWLIPSDFVIIKKRIPGYNNILYRPSSGMRFGLNYSKLVASNSSRTPSRVASPVASQTEGLTYAKKVHQQGGNHLDNMANSSRIPSGVASPVASQVLESLVHRPAHKDRQHIACSPWGSRCGGWSTGI